MDFLYSLTGTTSTASPHPNSSSNSPEVIDPAAVAADSPPSETRDTPINFEVSSVQPFESQLLQFRSSPRDIDPNVATISSHPLETSANPNRVSLTNSTIPLTAMTPAPRNGYEDMDTSTMTAEQESQQNILRRKILEIQKDATLSPTEKAAQIQKVMLSNWRKGNTAKTQDSAMEDHESTTLLMEPEYNDPNLLLLGCSHYQRGCRIKAACCGKWFVCRLCHDEQSNHQINRHATTTMACMHCKLIQPVGQTCQNTECGKVLGHYYCTKCRLFDNDQTKSIYHCDKCGICRIGKGHGIDYFHCDKCNVCMAMALKDQHKCIERNLESDCPICGDYMFTSTSMVIFMPCGHCIHYNCHMEYIQSSYQCPTCFKSLGNMTDYFKRIDSMLEQSTMPPEYEHFVSSIFCNDCEEKSQAKYHFLYHKCAHCGSYNTKVLQTFQQQPIQHNDEETDNQQIEEAS